MSFLILLRFCHLREIFARSFISSLYISRDLDRERAKLEAQEKKIIADIKKMAKQGQMVTLFTPIYIVVVRVHSGFLLVTNCDLLEDRRTLKLLQRQANHSNFRISTANGIPCFV